MCKVRGLEPRFYQQPSRLRIRNADCYECYDDEYAENDVFDIAYPRGREFRRRCVQRVKVESREMGVSAVNVYEQDKREATTP